VSVASETAWNKSVLPPAPLRRFTVDEYHRMIETGVFGPDDRVELLNGWIINLAESKIEVYSDPSPTGYRQRNDYRSDESVPLVLEGREVAKIPVADLLP
jgi:hypothetical protein